jgi:hypothetical protein
MLDIIQSYIIRGAIILVIVQAMISLQQTMYKQSLQSQADQEMFQMSAVLSSDLRQAGSDTSTTKPNYFTIADTNTLKFDIGDSLSFTTPHVISYTVTKPSTYYVLNRSVDGGSTLPVGRNLTRFQCQFIDSTGKTLTPTPLSATNRGKIKSIAILAKMQHTTLAKDTVWSIWQAKIYPQNLQFY